MTHLDEGTLQAFLDDGLPVRERAGDAEHLLVCGECRAELDALTRTNARLAAALTRLDVPAPAAAPPVARRRWGFGGLSLVRAAVLVLVIAAAASATVPGSPVREWLVEAVRPAPTPVEAPGPVPRVVRPPAADVPAAPVGVGLSEAREVEVLVTGLEDARIRLLRSDATGVSVSAVGTLRDPVFRIGSDRIEVVGGAGGELVVEVPRGARLVRLVVDGRRYAEIVDGALSLLEPGEEDGAGVVWR
ncbi:MAG: hypothetical protein KY466_03765 [Gemmatimonadetes bacterium]|nr:hypothetical protein [Gemmatimonadota bacterium]